MCVKEVYFYETSFMLEKAYSIGSFDELCVQEPGLDDKLREILIKIYSKLDIFHNSNDSKIKSEIFQRIVSYINSLSELELLLLMSNENEIIRSLSAKSYVNKVPENLVHDIDEMLMHSNEFLRDSAVFSLCYINSPKILKMLFKATKDNCEYIRIRAITGIVDIAMEYSNNSAKNFLKDLLNQEENLKVKEFLEDELSLLDLS